MADQVTIKRATGDWDNAPTTYISQQNQGPCWIRALDVADNVCKPLIKCNCGELVALAYGHHVHSDGKVTNSFYHREPEGCGWHVFLTLDGWTGEDLPPETE